MSRYPRLPLAAVLTILISAAISAQEQKPARRFSIPALVTTAVFAPDGATIVAWDPGGWSSWDAASGNRRGREPVIGKGCERTAALPRSADGRVIAAQCKDTLFFFDAATGRLIGDRPVAQNQTAAMYTASANGSAIAVVRAGAMNTVTVGTIAAGPSSDVKVDGEVEDLSLSASGDRLSIGTIKGVEVRESPGGKLLRTFAGRPAHALSGDGRLLAIASDRGAQIFDVDTGNRVAEVEGRVSSLRFSPDGKRLVGWTNQRAITWDATTGAQQLVLKSDEFVDAAISPDGTRLVTVSLDRRGESTSSVLAVWRLP